MSKDLLIHDLSKQLDITTKTIRYYEKVGILKPERNTSNNYRVYTEKDIKKLDFIKRARAMNFSVDEIKQIINIKEEGYYPCNKVLSLLKQKISDLDKSIQEMIDFRNHLIEQVDNFESNLELGKNGEVCGWIENFNSLKEKKK